MKNNNARFRQQKRLTALKRRRRVKALRDIGALCVGEICFTANALNYPQAKLEAPRP